MLAAVRRFRGARFLAPLVASTMLSASLSGQPADAAPAFSRSTVDADSYFESSGVTPCSFAATESAPVADRPVPENGAPVTAGTSASGTLTRNADPTDVITFASRLTGSARVASTVAGPDTLALVADGSISATTKSDAGCRLYLSSDVGMVFDFTLTQARFLTVTTSATDHASGAFGIERDERFTFEVIGRGNGFDGISTAYLPAGEYRGSLAAHTSLSTNGPVPATPVAVSINARFSVPGSQTSAPRGKAARFVSLPAARSCATDSLDAKITTIKRAAQVRSVRVFVDDRPVAKARTPRRGQVIKAPAAGGSAVDVRAVVTLRAVKRGRPGKSYEVTASYAPCR